MGRLLRNLGLVVLLLETSGCSFATVRTVTRHPRSCTTSYAAPIADAALTAAAAAFIATQRVEYGWETAATIGTTIAFAGSATHGFVAVTNCRSERDEDAEEETPERSSTAAR